MVKYLIIMFACGLAACKSGDKKEKKAGPNEMFPVSSFVNGELQQVDSLQVPVLKYITTGHKTDTTLISIAECKALAREFLEPDITSPALRSYYKETSFADQSVPNVTFTYSTDRRDLEVQRLDVIIDPDPILTDKVKSVYMEKFIRNDSLFISKKLFWKAGNSFQIITSRQAGNQPPGLTQMKIAWNLTD